MAGAACVGGVMRWSAGAIYGRPGRVPIAEDTPPAPVNPYGETKLVFERLLERWAKSHGLRSVSLRYFNAAGATERHGEDHAPETHLIPSVLRVAGRERSAVEVYGTDYATPDRTAVRDDIHVRDLADAHVRALDATVDGAQAVNLGTGTGQSVLSVVAAAPPVTAQPIPTVSQPRRPGELPLLLPALRRAAA